MARYHSYDDSHFQRTDLGPAHFPQLIPPGSNFQHGPVAQLPLPEIRVPPWSISGPGRGYPIDGTPMGYGSVEERRHSEIPSRSGDCHVPTPSPPIALRYFPPPGEYRHGPPPRQELAPTAPGVQPGKAGGPRPCEFNLRPRDECGPPEPVQPRDLAPFVVRDISKVLQERESLRKDRGVYLTRTQSLAMEMVRLQKQLRELAGPGTMRLGHEEPKLWAFTQLLERIEAQLSSLRRADDLAIDQLLRLQQESVHLGHPPPALPWTSDTDILLPEQGNKKRRADDTAMDQLLRLQQKAMHLGHPPPALPWKHPQPRPQEPPHPDPPRPQHPPHSDPPRPQHPLTATVRPLLERHTGLIKSVKASDDPKEAPDTGLIMAKVCGEPMEIYFSKDEHPATLLPSDLVTFQVLTDLPTNQPRAVNIQLKLPETFQVTQEKRKRGLIMDIKDGSCSIMSENHSNLWADMRENLSEGDLGVMDEVEFTALPVS
ncbi:uncharacterized protein LOC105897398 isoform X2 [Clupea harengus]|uniref:Uncharacterized protein LOC105897398 isoform X2 n=1 Tax=Clupea harengus TaxID=7950 RepID=A0A6P8GKL5_CLUHA|nr:uncharacterized protein LOC105897398 isoform X2 [Clupea harengus]